MLEDRILNDKRFNIDQQAFPSLRKDKIIHYSVVDIPIYKIKRNLFGRIMPIEETDVYKYIENPNDNESIKSYRDYCRIALEDNPNRSKELFDQLINSFNIDEYDPRKGIIIIDQHNCVIDGQHRLCILRKKYGRNYIIRALKLYYLCFSPRVLFSLLKYDIKKRFH